MYDDVIKNIKRSFTNYFSSSQSKEIEDLFNDMTIILWKHDDNEIKYTFDSKETSYSNLLKKYLHDNWNDIVGEYVAGFSLSKSKSPIVFADSESNTLVAVLIHEILHSLLNKRLNTSHVVKHDFLVESMIEYTTQEILLIYNSMLNQNNTQFSTYLQIDEILGFPIKRIHQQIEDIIKNDTISMSEFVSIPDRMIICTYFQEVLNKAYTGDREKSFKEQHKEIVNEYSNILDMTAENIIRSYSNYQEKNKSYRK